MGHCAPCQGTQERDLEALFGHWSFLTPGLSTLPAQFDPKTLDLERPKAGVPIVRMYEVFGGKNSPMSGT